MFNLKIDYLRPKNPIATAAIGGVANASFAKQFEIAGLVSMGGFSIDAPTQKASHKIVERGREEFLIDAENIISVLDGQLTMLDRKEFLLNVRVTQEDALEAVARLVRHHGGAIEIDAHCRQNEMMGVGAGQALLDDVARLSSIIETCKGAGAVVSVKWRANVVNDVKLAEALEGAGADILHVDAMGVSVGGWTPNDPDVISKIRDATSLFVIANNSVVDIPSAKSMFSRGADMVSIARPLISGEGHRLLSELVGYVEEMQKTYG